MPRLKLSCHLHTRRNKARAYTQLAMDTILDCATANCNTKVLLRGSFLFVAFASNNKPHFYIRCAWQTEEQKSGDSDTAFGMVLYLRLWITSILGRIPTPSPLNATPNTQAYIIGCLVQCPILSRPHLNSTTSLSASQSPRKLPLESTRRE